MSGPTFVRLIDGRLREQLLHRVRDAIQPQGLHLTADQVRLVLDAIEAA